MTDAEQMNPAISNASPIELIDARFALEPHICRLAVLHARPQELERADELAARMERCAGDPTEFSELDAAFHMVLAESTRNQLLIWIVRQINIVRNEDQWLRMRRLILNESTISLYNNQHRQILNAIRTREPERAAALMKDHLESARLSLTRASET